VKVDCCFRFSLDLGLLVVCFFYFAPVSFSVVTVPEFTLSVGFSRTLHKQ